jgi:hypothetical protein
MDKRVKFIETRAVYLWTSSPYSLLTDHQYILLIFQFQKQYIFYFILFVFMVTESAYKDFALFCLRRNVSLQYQESRLWKETGHFEKEICSEKELSHWNPSCLRLRRGLYVPHESYLAKDLQYFVFQFPTSCLQQMAIFQRDKEEKEEIRNKCKKKKQWKTLDCTYIVIIYVSVVIERGFTPPSPLIFLLVTLYMISINCTTWKYMREGAVSGFNRSITHAGVLYRVEAG